jgi:PAS domain S-box-containing protein
MEKHYPRQSSIISELSPAQTIAHLTSIIDNAPGFVYSIDTNFDLIAINNPLKNGLYETFGISPSPGDNVIKFFQAVDPLLIEEWKALYAQALNGKNLHFVKEFGVSQTSFWEFFISAIRGDNVITGIVCFIHNVTDRELKGLEHKKTQECLLRSQANMRHILDNSNTGCLLLDKDLKILSSNRLANDWALSELGISLKEGEEFLTHFPEKYKPLATPIMKKVMSGTTHAYEARYIKRDQLVRWYHVRLAPIADKHNVLGLCIVATDITQNKTAEEEIKSLNDSLEKKVNERTTELEEANKELEAFTYSVSHDLLSPLRNIDSFIDIMIEDYRTKLNEEGQYTLGVIKRNSTLMSRLIEDLLNFARYAKAPLSKQLVNMNSTVNEVIDELRFMTNKLAAKIILHDMNPAFCDAQLIKQVWVNLLSNAIKYSKTKKSPQIEIGSTEGTGRIIYFIKDNGVGFDVQYADKLFGVFQRLHRSSEFEGTGVGLAIVHRIITKHGGKIWAESTPEKGAIFYFTL